MDLWREVIQCLKNYIKSKSKSFQIIIQSVKNYVKLEIESFVNGWPDTKVAIKTWFLKFLRRRWRRFKRVFEKPRKFLKWVFYIIVIIKTKATPRKVLKLIKWCVVRLGSFGRSSCIILLTQNWYHHDIKFYLIINGTVFFLLKMYQEVYYNFSCPVATLLYGKFVRRERTKKKELDEKRKKPKLHKFVRDPFHNKEERRKKIEAKEKKFAERAVIETEKINTRLIWFWKMRKNGSPWYLDLRKRFVPQLKKYKREQRRALREQQNK